MVKKGSGLRLAVLLLTLFLCVGCFIGLGSKTAFAADIVASSCQTFCSWELDSDGLLRIFPRKDTDEYTNPWTGYADSIKKIVVEDGVQADDWAVTLFKNLKNCTEMDLSGFDTSNVTNMKEMFCNCTSLTKLNLGNFNTSNVTNMQSMFHSCSNLTELDVSGFDTSNVTNMSYMFYDCKGLSKLKVDEFDTSKVVFAEFMFYSCNKLTELNVSNFDTSNVTTMANMFYNCRSLTELNVSGFDTSNVTNMCAMFWWCNRLTELDVSGFDTSKVASMSEMFKGCSNVTELDVSGFDTSNVTTMQAMFNSCYSLTGLDVRGFDTSNVTTMQAMFNCCYALTELDVSGFRTSNVTNMGWMFSECTHLTELNVNGFDTSKVTDMEWMFTSNYMLQKILFSDSFQFVGTNHYFNRNNWVKTRNADGSKTYDKTEYTAAQLTALTADTTPSIGGTWCRFGVEDYTQNADGSVEYISADDSWDIISDNVWSYTFKVFDDSLVYRLFEDIMNGYASEAMSPYYITVQENQATVTNTAEGETGKVIITKTVEVADGVTLPDSEVGREFEFTITLSGEEISGTQTFNNVVFKDGVGKFFLKDGQKKEFTLPVGTRVKVEESYYSNYYTGFEWTSVQVVNEKSRVAALPENETFIESENINTIHFTNTYLEGGLTSLTLKKTTSDNYTGKEKFVIRGYFEDLLSNATYTWSDGTSFRTNADGKGYCTVEISANEEITINIPRYCYYQFTEQAGDYVSSYIITELSNPRLTNGDFVAEGGNTQKNLDLSTNLEYNYYNEWVKVEFHNEFTTSQNLTVGKITLIERVDDSEQIPDDEKTEGTLPPMLESLDDEDCPPVEAAAKNKNTRDTSEIYYEPYECDDKFEFTIYFSNMEQGSSFSSTIGKVIADEDGTATKTFYLKDGETAEFYDIPVGVQYQVVETANDFRAMYHVEGTNVVQADGENTMVKKNLGTQIETVDANENGHVYFGNVKQRELAVRLTKSIDCQNNATVEAQLTNNKMYHLEGAEYQLIVDGKVVETLVTDADGVAISTNVFENGTTGILKEIKAPDGFLIDETEHEFTVSTSDGGAYCEVEVSDVPTFDPTAFKFQKTDAVTGKPQGSATFEGAVFKYEYFDNTDFSGSPTRVWYFKTDAKGQHGYHPNYLADGYSSDALYTDTNNMYMIPLGSVRITEIVSPAGYKVMPVMKATITQEANGAYAKWTFDAETLEFLKNESKDLYEADEPIDETTFGRVSVRKYDYDYPPQESLRLAFNFTGCEFTIYNLSENPVKVGDNPVANYGEAVMTIVTDKEGYATTDFVLPIGYYEIRETKGNEFYSCNKDWSRSFSVTAGNTATDEEFWCANVRKQEVTINKVDSEGNPLAGAKLQIKDADGKVVDEWTSTTEAHIVRLDEGTYTLHEKLPPLGYWFAEDIEFTVSDSISRANPIVCTGVLSSEVDFIPVENASEYLKISADNGKCVTGAVVEFVFSYNGEQLRTVQTLLGKYNGQLQMYGLAGCTVTVHVVSVPDGYTAEADKTVMFDENGFLSTNELVMFHKTDDSEVVEIEDSTITMVDNRISHLVSTGGTGTVITVVVAVVLGGMTGVLIYFGKKKSKEQEA